MTSSRAIAATIIADVIQQHCSLDTALQKITENITATDRSYIYELCYGTLRWYWQLNAIANKLLDKPLKAKDADINALLLIGLYQLIHLETPAHAAVHATVDATQALQKNWAKNLLNALLRRFLREQPALLANTQQQQSARFAHPDWLIQLIQKSWPNAWEQILDANNQRPPLFLRVNRLQQSRDHYLALLTEQNIAATADALTTSGIHLQSPVDIKQLPGFAAGAFSVQDSAAQLAASLLELQAGQHVLDACAAPGGKTAHILETEPALAKLTALEIDSTRITRIHENLTRLHLNATVICGDATQSDTWWDGIFYDRILLDAPCSATGVIRRHPDIKLLRRATDIAALSLRQERLLETLWPLLKPGGLLLYATCSVLLQEGSEVLQRFLAKHPDAQEEILPATIGYPLPIGRQLLPVQDGGDGFYYARLVKCL